MKYPDKKSSASFEPIYKWISNPNNRGDRMESIEYLLHNNTLVAISNHIIWHFFSYDMPYDNNGLLIFQNPCTHFKNNFIWMEIQCSIRLVEHIRQKKWFCLYRCFQPQSRISYQQLNWFSSIINKQWHVFKKTLSDDLMECFNVCISHVNMHLHHKFLMNAIQDSN